MFAEISWWAESIVKQTPSWYLYTNGQVVTDRFWDLGCGEPWKAMLLQIRFYEYAQDDHYKPQLGKFMNSTPIK